MAARLQITFLIFIFVLFKLVCCRFTTMETLLSVWISCLGSKNLHKSFNGGLTVKFFNQIYHTYTGKRLFAQPSNLLQYFEKNFIQFIHFFTNYSFRCGNIRRLGISCNIICKSINSFYDYDLHFHII